MSVLDVKNCTVCYQNGKNAVTDVTLSAEKGEIVSIVGESGSGKTTLIRAILGLLPPGGRITSGQILFDGRDLAALDEAKLQSIRGREISMIFQDMGASLDPIRKIGRQYTESIAVHEKLAKPEYSSRALAALRRVHMPDPGRVLDSYPFELSGGMKQRVGIAMGITAQPKLLLADEPTSALDVTIQAQVVYRLKRLRDEFGATIILVTHNMGVASYISDRIAVMHNSALVEFGTRDDVIYHPREKYTQDLLDAVPKLGGKRYAR